MIKIGVISDTHIPANCPQIPKQLLDRLKGVDFILHAGDITELSAIEQLNKVASVTAVSGNMDSFAVKAKLPQKKTVTVGNFKIGLIHELGRASKRLETVHREFCGIKIDAVVFGHTHCPLNETTKGILFFNPGSPTDGILSPYKSIGIISVSDKVVGEIIKLNS